jgi:hypothetical protein
VRRASDDRVSLDFDLDLSALFELDLVSVSVGQGVWNAYLAIQVIRAFYGDLCFLWFAGTGMRANDLLDSTGKRSTWFRLF